MDTAQQGRGVARELYARAEAVARERGFRTMWLGVWEENLRAQAVYERLGFKRVGAHDFKMGECVQTDFIYCKSL